MTLAVFFMGSIGWWTWLTLRVPLLGSPQLLQRIALTVVFLALARVGQFIPVPGVDFAAVVKAAAGASMHLSTPHNGVM